jgi:hypothetical protein
MYRVNDNSLPVAADHSSANSVILIAPLQPLVREWEWPVAYSHGQNGGTAFG